MYPRIDEDTLEVDERCHLALPVQRIPSTSWMIHLSPHIARGEINMDFHSSKLKKVFFFYIFYISIWNVNIKKSLPPAQNLHNQIYWNV